MPQSLASLGVRQGWHIGGTGDVAPSRKRPELAALALDAIAYWSQTEAALSEIMMNMMGASAIPASAMFNALVANSTQTAALRAVAEAVLDEDNLLAFEVLMQMFKACGKERNKLAHWYYGFHASFEDGILLCKPSAVRRQSNSIRSGSDQPDPRMPEDIYLYRANDLIHVANEILELSALLGDFALSLRDDLKHIPAIAERFQQRHKPPRYEEALSRLSERRKNNP